MFSTLMKVDFIVMINKAKKTSNTLGFFKFGKKITIAECFFQFN